MTDRVPWLSSVLGVISSKGFSWMAEVLARKQKGSHESRRLDARNGR